MALIVVTILDDDDGSVDVKCVSEPSIPMKGQRDVTAAQALALAMLEAAADSVTAARSPQP